MGAGQPTGEQFEITNGAARAVITEVGASLRVFEVGGVPYVTTYPEADVPPLSAGRCSRPGPTGCATGSGSSRASRSSWSSPSPCGTWRSTG